jgi:hypothetical protein
MTTRIPHSLSWLVNQRARIDGEINCLKVIIKNYCLPIEEKIKSLEEDLQALDRTLSLHEIKIRPEIIPPIKGRRIKLKHGELSRLIIEAITKSHEGMATDREIRLYVAIESSLILNKNIPAEELRESVKSRIKNLCKDGKLIRIPRSSKGPYRHYSLKV